MERTSRNTSSGMFIISESEPAVRRLLPLPFATASVLGEPVPSLRLLRARFLGGCSATGVVRAHVNDTEPRMREYHIRIYSPSASSGAS